VVAFAPESTTKLVVFRWRLAKVSMKHKWCYLPLVFGVFISVASGCGKSEATGSTATTNSIPVTNAGTVAAPSEADIMISDRSIDYLQGLIEAKNFQKANEALQHAESRPLTAAQKQRVARLKAQLPKN
jgi:hypothetical protein